MGECKYTTITAPPSTWTPPPSAAAWPPPRRRTIMVTEHELEVLRAKATVADWYLQLLTASNPRYVRGRLREALDALSRLKVPSR